MSIKQTQMPLCAEGKSAFIRRNGETARQLVSLDWECLTIERRQVGLSPFDGKAARAGARRVKLFPIGSEALGRDVKNCRRSSFPLVAKAHSSAILGEAQAIPQAYEVGDGSTSLQENSILRCDDAPRRFLRGKGQLAVRERDEILDGAVGQRNVHVFSLPRFCPTPQNELVTCERATGRVEEAAVVGPADRHQVVAMKAVGIGPIGELESAGVDDDDLSRIIEADGDP